MYSHGEYEQRDLAEAGRRAAEDGVGFVSSAVGIRTATDVSNVLVSVEIWSSMPLLLADEPSFDFAREGVLDLPDGRWHIAESLDSTVRLGVELPIHAGRYGVRVTAYNNNAVLDRFQMALAGPDEDFGAALEELQHLEYADAERYRVQLWPMKQRRSAGRPAPAPPPNTTTY